MRNLLPLCALAFMVIGISAAAEIDRTTGLPATDVESGFVSLESGNILWDTTHGLGGPYDPSGLYSDLAGSLASTGNSITVTDQGVDNVDLSPFCVLVVSVGSAWLTPYTSSEVAAITTFVADGGGLLVLSDNDGTPSGPNLNPVTEAFGTTVAVSYPQPSDLYFTDFAAHEIFTGVNELYYRASGEIEGVAPSVEVAWTDNAETMIAVVDPYSVVVTADMNFCTNTYIGMADNEAFILNVFTWLCSGPVGTETRSWSDVKAMFR